MLPRKKRSLSHSHKFLVITTALSLLLGGCVPFGAKCGCGEPVHSEKKDQQSAG